jgi:hypothetical protein
MSPYFVLVSMPAPIVGADLPGPILAGGSARAFDFFLPRPALKLFEFFCPTPNSTGNYHKLEYLILSHLLRLSVARTLVPG